MFPLFVLRLQWPRSPAAARCGWPQQPWCGWTKIKPGAGLRADEVQPAPFEIKDGEGFESLQYVYNRHQCIRWSNTVAPADSLHQFTCPKRIKEDESPLMYLEMSQVFCIFWLVAVLGPGRSPFSSKSMQDEDTITHRSLEQLVYKFYGILLIWFVIMCHYVSLCVIWIHSFGLCGQLQLGQAACGVRAPARCWYRHNPGPIPMPLQQGRGRCLETSRDVWRLGRRLLGRIWACKASAWNTWGTHVLTQQI